MVVVHERAGLEIRRKCAFGPSLAAMTDAEVLELFNDMLEAQVEIAASVDPTLTEIPPDYRQIEYNERSDHWVPRGQVPSRGALSRLRARRPSLGSTLTRSAARGRRRLARLECTTNKERRGECATRRLWRNCNECGENG